ncbi:MAG TPA: endo-1,4-beta-xylanase [Abditibacteriaceae bacterium]
MVRLYRMLLKNSKNRSFSASLLTLLAVIPLLLVTSLAPVLAQNPTLTIEAGQPIAKVSPLHYGLMTEEINFSYDGGLYAELVRNRTFLDHAQTPVHWTAIQGNGSSATIALDRVQPLNANLPISLRLDITAASHTAPAGVANGGYWGIPVKRNTLYRAPFYAKAASSFSGPLTIAITSEDGAIVYARSMVRRLTSDWRLYTVTLRTGNVTPTTKARFALTMDRPGTAWFNLVSLFPPTWKNRANGLRPDLMQMLVDMKPKFLRFPGGNYLEGSTIATRFDWKKTLGPLTQRPGHPGPWGYRSTDGMGLMEFLLWCEDMGAEPVLGVYAGYSLGGEYVKPGPDLVPYVQDALDEIEYVSGPVTSKWGAQRARDGHRAPFKLRYVEVGNEDFFDKSGSYDGRFAQFYDAIKARYPRLKVVSSVGFEQPADKRVHSRQPDTVDEHYYRSAEQFIRMSPNHYERYERKAPEIFVGEWAAHEEIVPWDARSRNLPPTPSMKAALGDAAFMTAMERNSDLVVMQCYAPLLVNVNPGGRQWRPNLIGYDALRSFGSPSYYAFQMFSRNVGDSILKTTMTDAPLLTSVTQDSKSGAIFIKHVNPQAAPQPMKINLEGVRSIRPMATAVVMAADPNQTNSIDAPRNIMPVTLRVSGISPSFTHTFPPNSITMLRLEAPILQSGVRTTVATTPPSPAPLSQTSQTQPAPNPQAAPQQTAPRQTASQGNNQIQNVPPLKDAFKGKLLIGTAVGTHLLRGQDPATIALIQRHYDALTAENAMKPDALQPREGQFNFADADRLVEMAEQSGAKVVGHTLVWHSQTPRWFFQGLDGQPASRELALERLRNHIKMVVGRYKGRIKQWDVVNEAINDGPGIMRPSPWLSTIGEDYIAEAFRAAHEADPDAILVYNDYNIELGYKRSKALELLKKLIDQKVPIHAVGIQCHWRIQNPPLAEAEESIKQYSALGLKVMITELDIGVLPTRYQGADISTRETMTQEQATVMNPYTKGLPDEVAQQHAERYRQAFELFLRYKDVIGRITLWGPHDGNSWLDGFPIRGRTDHPLLFDRQHKAKPAFFAVQKAAQSSP